MTDAWTLQRILDRQEITDLLALYCRGIDRVDEATLRSIYHPDATEDRGEKLFVGRAHDWIPWTMSVLPAFAATQHCIMNSLIEFENDHIAHGETYFGAYHRFGKGTGSANADVAWPEGETELLLAGRYLDRFEKRDGCWKIAHRKMVNDWCRTQAAADGWFRENPTAYRSRRTIADTRP